MSYMMTSSSKATCLMLIAGLSIISGLGLFSSTLAAGQLQDSVKSLVHDSFRALDKELTRLTSSNGLEDNRAAVRSMLEQKETPSVKAHKNKRTLKHLAESFVELRGEEDRNIDELCNARNLANLRFLIEAMAKSSKHPTREPESSRRLNLLLIKQTNSVRSACYEHLFKKWDAQATNLDTKTFDDPSLAPLDNVPFAYLFSGELKRHKQQDSSKHEELVPLIEHLQNLQVEQKAKLSPGAEGPEEVELNQILLENLVKPCKRLTESHLAREILQPRVDLTTIALVVYHQVDMAHSDYKNYFIKSLPRFIMCQKLMTPKSRTRQHLMSELEKIGEANESRKLRKRFKKMGAKVFSSS